MRILAIGLGSQRPSSEFRDVLESSVVFARHSDSAAEWLRGLDIPLVRLDRLFSVEDVTGIPEQVRQAICERDIETEQACYLVPGAASVGDETVRYLSSRVDVEVIPGSVGVPSAVGSVRIVDALSLAIAERRFPFDAGAESLDPLVATLVTNVRGDSITSLAARRIARDLDVEAMQLESDCLLFEATKSPGARASYTGLEQIVSTLRSPEGCPWDREQTIESLLPQLVEELDEFRDALAGGESDDMAEELGDVLLHIAMIAQIGREAGSFTSSDVQRSITAKMVRRHPHVFGDVEIESVDELYSMWDEIKRQEKAERG